MLSKFSTIWFRLSDLVSVPAELNEQSNVLAGEFHSRVSSPVLKYSRKKKIAAHIKSQHYIQKAVKIRHSFPLPFLEPQGHIIVNPKLFLRS